MQREVRDWSNCRKLRSRGSLDSHNNADEGGGNKKGELNNEEDNNNNGQRNNHLRNLNLILNNNKLNS